eukprot:PhF_6_TR38111/c0_g1_i1/m.56879/K00803/AGPS, agpS; alkyldihydroxyacetonephosphate synthase
MTSNQDDTYRNIKWNGWGSRDLAMRVDGADPLLVLHPTGKRIPGLVPFINQEIHGMAGGDVKPLTSTPSLTLEEASKKLTPPLINKTFVSELKFKPDQVKSDAESRICHAVGKNYRDLWRARNGLFAKVPDLVIFPESHEQVVVLMQAAVKHNVVLIPFGGGTNVVGAIEANPFDKRCAVSVDLRRMKKLLSVDKASSLARFEVGVLGPDMDKQLAPHGFMFGHDPDSYTHSTLGGWIATRSSGAQSNKYGEIEQMVLSLTVVTPTGVIQTPTAVRAVGPNLNEVFIGSEGAFGIITEAVVKVERIPQHRQYEGWLFEGFEHGFSAFREVTNTGLNITVLRLYDEDETKLSFALKTESNLWQHLLSNGVKKYLQTCRGFNLERLSLCIVGFEGSTEDVNNQSKVVSSIFHKYRSFRVGTSAGKNWQEKKYDLPYVRDFTLQHGLWADVFETAVEYGTALSLWRDVKKAVKDTFAAANRKGWIGMHTAHQYKMGTCCYFTFAGQQIDKATDLEFFLKVKQAGMNAILKNRGNLTHHHGVGFEHVPWMRQFMGEGGSATLLAMKQQFDPANVCNPGKLLPLKPNEDPQGTMFFNLTGKSKL